MGAIAGMLGLAGGQGGTGFSTVQGVTPDQLKAAYAGTQGSLAQQQALLQALGAQGGIQNQQQVYQQLQDIAAGKTGNVAQAQLQQATAQNVAQQAALQAGQRGAGANVGLMARQIGQQGAATQQQAAQQAAALMAQQQLGAIQGAGNLATTQVGQQMGAQQAATQAQLEQQGQLQAANTAYSQQQAELAKGEMGMAGQAIGGIGQGIGASFGLAGKPTVPTVPGKAHGGEIEPNFADGGAVAMPSIIQTYLQKMNPKMASGGDVGEALKSGGHVPGHASVKGDSLKNDTVHAMLSPGEIVIPRSVAQSSNPVDGAARFVAAMQAKKGKK